MTHQTILGIDFGTKRIGLAIAVGPIAEPLEVISPDKALPYIKSLIQKYQVTDIVVGVSEGQMAVTSTAFAKQIEEDSGLPVHLQNETLSSFEVHQRLQDSQAKKSKRHGPIDHYAAALILQDFLDTLPIS